MKTNQLVVVRGYRAITTSMKIAESFGKAHKEIIDAIINIGCSDDFIAWNIEMEIISSKSPNQATYGRFVAYLTRDGFAILSGIFTDPKYMSIKEEYLFEFGKTEYRLLGGSIIDACLEISELAKEQRRLTTLFKGVYGRDISAIQSSVALQK